MKCDVHFVLIGAMAVVQAMPAAAQPAAQPAGQTPTPVVQPAPSSPSENSAAGSEQSSKSTAPKEKTCETVMIHAGPNQGQVINRCKHYSKADTRPGG